jgi:hypothetical protein
MHGKQKKVIKSYIGIPATQGVWGEDKNTLPFDCIEKSYVLLLHVVVY